MFAKPSRLRRRAGDAAPSAESSRFVETAATVAILQKQGPDPIPAAVQWPSRQAAFADAND